MALTDYELEIVIRVDVTSSATSGAVLDTICDAIREDGLDSLRNGERPAVKKAWINETHIRRGPREPGGH